MPFPNLLPLGSPLLSEGLGEAFPFGEGDGGEAVEGLVEGCKMGRGEAVVETIEMAG